MGAVWGTGGSSHGSGSREPEDSIHSVRVFVPELSPFPKEKYQRLLDRSLGWESWGCCGLDNLWEKFPGETPDRRRFPRASVNSISDQPGGPQEGKGDYSARPATSSGRATSRRAEGARTLSGATASRAPGFAPSVAAVFRSRTRSVRVPRRLFLAGRRRLISLPSTNQVPLSLRARRQMSHLFPSWMWNTLF